MTGIFESENLKSDFTEFQAVLLKTNEFKFAIDETHKPHLKKYHRITYALALVENKLEALYNDRNKFLFINEILSDLLSNASISFIGFQYASEILKRRILENFYNHIYYFEHPVEFELLNLGKNEYTPILELKNYLIGHPRIKALKEDKIKQFNDSIFQEYQELCRVVHTKGDNFMGLAKNLQEIKPEYSLTPKIEKTNKDLLSILYILFKFHEELEYTATEQDIIVKSFPKDIRSNLLE